MRRIAEKRINPVRRHGHIVERFVVVNTTIESSTISPDQFEDILEFVAGKMSLMRLKFALGKEITVYGLMGPAQDSIVVTLGKYLCEA
mgnify:CR=1 FL=1